MAKDETARPGADQWSEDGEGGVDGERALLARLQRAEAVIAALAAEVRTRRLVVCDEAGDERIVADVDGGHAQVCVVAGHLRHATGPRRLEGSPPAVLPGPGRGGAQADGTPPTTEVVMFAAPGHTGMGPLAGVQIWAEGVVIATIEVGADGLGGWQGVIYPDQADGDP